MLWHKLLYWCHINVMPSSWFYQSLDNLHSLNMQFHWANHTQPRMRLDRCCYTYQTLWVLTGVTPPYTCQIVCLKQICHQQGNESLMKLMFKDRLHFPPPPFCDVSPPPGCKEEFSPTCWWENVMLTHLNTCKSGCVIFMCVYVWYGSTSSHTFWLSCICEAFEAWLVNIDTGVRVLFQGAIAC